MFRFTTKTVLYIVCTIIILTAAVIFLILKNPPQGMKSTQNSTLPSVSNDSKLDKFKGILDCFKDNTTKEQKCLDEFITKFAAETGETTKQLLAEVESYRGKDNQIETNCHPITHSIGRYTFSKYGKIGDAFEACDITCNNGCYHGVIERVFFTQEQIDNGQKHLTSKDFEIKIPDLCSPANFKDSNSSMIYNCLHGLGHAILFSIDYDYEEAFKICDLLTTDYEKNSCYGGVAMENVTAFDKTKRDLKMDDPQYPCKKLTYSEDYSAACYELQTSVMMEQGMGWEEIATECKKAGKYAPNCFLSLGRDLSNVIIGGDMPTAARVCEVYSGEFSVQCITNAAKTSMDREIRFGYEFCNKLAITGNKQICYLISNDYSSYSFLKTKAEIQANCTNFAGEFKDMCLATIQ